MTFKSTSRRQSYIMTSKYSKKYVATSKVRHDVRKFVQTSKIHFDIRKFVMTSRSSSLHRKYGIKKYLITSKNSSWRYKHVIMSNIRHNIKNTSLGQGVIHNVKICHDVKNSSKISPRLQKVRHNVKTFFMTSKICSDVKKFVITSKIGRKN